MELTQQRDYEIRPVEVAASAGDDENIASIWFADRESQKVRYVALSRDLFNSSLYVERDDQKWSSYDGITAVELQGGQLAIQLDSAGADRLGGVKLIRVDCRGFNEETLERMEHALRAMFAGSKVPLSIQ